MGEYRRKTLRSFYCEEDLWKAFDQLAREQDATIDQVLNAALRRALDGAPSEAAPEASAGPAAPAEPAAPTGQEATAPAATPPEPASAPTEANRPVLNAAIGGAAPAPALEDRPTLERMPAVAARPGPPPPPAAPPARKGPPPAPSAAPAPPSPSGARPTLYLHVEGRVVPVQQDRFVIGRGSKGTDLTIRDGNISRKHAVVLWHEGAFYIQDLGSTNGIEFNGNRIENKQIDEGDIFLICDHELNFSYRG